MNDEPTADTINERVREVAAHLPFPVELDADIGGTFALQIDLGRRGQTDDPRDTAGIDPDTARAEGCTAAVTAARTSAIHRASYPTAPSVDGAGQVASQPSAAATRDRSHER